MVPLKLIKIAYPTGLNEGAFICGLEHHRTPIIIGTTGDRTVAVYLGENVSFEEVSDGAGPAVIVEGYKIIIDPTSIEPFGAATKRFGSLVVRAGELSICAQGYHGRSYANVRIGNSDATELPGTYCFTRWKAVVDTGDETVTLLERLSDGSVVVPT